MEREELRLSPMESQILQTTACELVSLSNAAITVVFLLRLAGEAIDVDDARRRFLTSLLLELRATFLSTPW